MNKRELEKLLRKEGFEKKSGGRHDIWIKANFPPIPVPRHKGDIPIGTVEKILKFACIRTEK